MAETQKDYNATINVGGVLTHWNGIQGGGGALKEYSNTPVGGPPGFDSDPDVRELLEFTITTRIVGVDQAAREAFVAKFARGTEFACKASPSGASEMFISNEPEAIGKTFTVVNRNPNHKFEDNSELTIVIKESGPTPVA